MSKCSAFYTGLETKGNKDEKTVPIAIFNGKYFSFRTSFSKIWSILKTFWCYGISLIRMDMRVRSTLKKFISIYDLQAKGQAFVIVPNMLKAMGGEEMFELTQMSTKDYMLRKLGWPEKLVDELVTGALRMNYGQGGEVNAFTGFVALAGMEDSSLWSAVLRGNKVLVLFFMKRMCPLSLEFKEMGRYHTSYMLERMQTRKLGALRMSLMLS